jgi:hypothetical protein
MVGEYTGGSINGFQTIDAIYRATLTSISTGKVSIPLWSEYGSEKKVMYSGNDTISVMVAFYDSEKVNLNDLQRIHVAVIRFESVKFSNGRASISWKDGVVVNK